MDIRQTIESVTREVVMTMKEKEAKEQQPKVLFIFCDSKAHELFQDEFINLNNNNISYDLLFLDGETSSWLGSHQIECSGADKIIASDEHAPAPIELPKLYDGIILPEIDMDDAARIVNGLKGTIKAEIVFSALVTEKFLLIGSDTPGLKRSDRKCLNKLELPSFYQEKFNNYLNEINSMGVQLARSKEIVKTAIKKMNETKRNQEEIVNLKKSRTLSPTFDGKILTANWVNSNLENINTTILLENRTIISPLAQDILKDSAISVKYIDE